MFLNVYYVVETGPYVKKITAYTEQPLITEMSVVSSKRRETETVTDRQTEKGKDRQAGRTDRQADRTSETERGRQKEIHRETDRQTETERDRENTNTNVY